MLPSSLYRSRQHGDACQVAACGGSTTRLCYESLRCARLDRTRNADLLLLRPRSALYLSLPSCAALHARARSAAASTASAFAHSPSRVCFLRRRWPRSPSASFVLAAAALRAGMGAVVGACRVLAAQVAPRRPSRAWPPAAQPIPAHDRCVERAQASSELYVCAGVSRCVCRRSTAV